MELNNDNLKELGAWLKERRESKGISTYEMQMDHRIFKRTLDAIENGTGCNIKSLAAYCDAVGVKIMVEYKKNEYDIYNEFS